MITEAKKIEPPTHQEHFGFVYQYDSKGQWFNNGDLYLTPEEAKKAADGWSSSTGRYVIYMLNLPI